ncbi:SixA phosphatase family protein [Methylobrevis pamukkalensis]|uniref:Histidine phosphatase superfamily (Branch 1) n=1 Tax=Methylobrevis pamukkalensis TaxID=1439726 RepID=A0A1E3H3M8_9HYPH|nr:histidine phosphatase family protein [Methylobrevis pamukkalensis]ODN70755.1 Histidine phosphatase superfamily (branch 1) [Methylobrevis pamukkalensis]
MARLFLLRHAKSSWDDPSVRDFDRPLNLRGRAAASLMGRHMADHALVPDRVLCSSARRTRETFAGVLPFFSADMDVRFVKRLYEAPQSAYLKTIQEVGGTAKSLMLIGHNPTMQSFALDLIDRGNPMFIDQLGEKFPTAGLAVIDFDLGEWGRLAPKSGRIVAFFRPRELELVGAEETAEVDD